MSEPIKLDFIGGDPGPKGRFNKNWRYRLVGLSGEPELYCSPGHTAQVTPKYAEVRGLSSRNNHAYCVSGDTLYRINTNMAATSKGTLLTNSGYVSMASSRTELMLVDDNNYGYICNYSTGALAQITDADFLGALNCVCLRNFFIYPVPNSDRIYCSKITAETGDSDGTSVDGLDLKFLSVVHDDLMGVGTMGDLLWAFGKKSIEPLNYTGYDDFPWSTMNTTINVGCGATNSICNGDNAMFWLNENREICRSNGATDYVVIAHEELTRKIQKYSRVDDAIFYYKSIGGHGCLVCIFPAEGVTWCHDVTIDIAQSWTQWVSGVGPNQGRHRSNCYTHFVAAGKHLIGDYSNGKISELSLDTRTDDGDNILVERIPPVSSANGLYVRYDSLEICGKKGVGDNTTTDPQLMLEWSNDSEGQTWKNQLTRSMGEIGEYEYSSIFRNLGRSKLRTWKLTCTENVEKTLTAANLKAKVLRF